MKTTEELQAQLDEIQAELNKRKEAKFEVGKVYKLETFDNVRCMVTRFNQKEHTGFGVSHHYEWSDTIFFGSISEWVPCPISEWQQALEKEAAKRGFKEGVKVDRTGLDEFIGTMMLSIDNSKTLYMPSEDRLIVGGLTVYQRGKWAKILTDEKIMIGRYEVVIHPRAQETTIDGHTFTKQFWQAAKLISEHSKAKIMIGCSKQFDVSLEVINQILSKL